MKPKFISGPPGTGKTNFFIKEKYEELVKQYGHEKIIILSHTNVAADEIREVILNLPLMKEKGVRKKALEHKICTIHHYCKHKLLRKDVFSEEDFSNLVIETGERSSLFSKDEKNLDKHKFFRFLNDAHGNGYYDNLHEFWNKRTTDRRSYKYSFEQILKMKEVYDSYKKRNNLYDFIDMIQEFINKALTPELDALIIDEAQDSNKPQIKAIEKMATHVKDGHFYMVGDADQTIFEFAGSDPEYFHILSKEAVELKQGKRCGQAINNLCKSIIKPIWDHYGYTRKWLPAVYTEKHLKENKIEQGYKVGDIIKGNGYYLPDLKGSGALDILLNKIKNTNQTFLFTYRGTPSDKKFRDFFINNALEFSHIKNTSFVSKKELRCHYLWPKFIKGEPMSLTQIKAFWDYMSSKVIVRGKSKTQDPFKDWIKKDYTIDNLINDGLLKPESKAYDDFRETRLKTDEERLIYINRVINKGFDFDGEIRVKYGNIHEVKGLTFDNVIVDETITRDEAFFVQRRLKYTAYSRGIFDYWTLRSNTNKQLGGINGSI
jgi:superfamily I DNA/RNA helicase